MNLRDSAFVLHTRPYRETSQLITLFTRQFGRFNAVGRGSRGGRHGSALRPFVSLQVEWRGKTDLKTLVLADPISSAVPFSGNLLYVGLYINELLMRVLHEHDPHEQLYEHYERLMSALPASSEVEGLLRQFEYNLLEELGYGLQLETTVDTGAPVSPEGVYRFMAGEGFVVAEDKQVGDSFFEGAHLLALANGNLVDPSCRHSAKRLMRMALQPYIGEKPLLSRALYQKSVTAQGVDC